MIFYCKNEIWDISSMSSPFEWFQIIYLRMYFVWTYGIMCPYVTEKGRQCVLLILMMQRTYLNIVTNCNSYNPFFFQIFTMHLASILTKSNVRFCIHRIRAIWYSLFQYGFRFTHISDHHLHMLNFVSCTSSLDSPSYYFNVS